MRKRGLRCLLPELRTSSFVVKIRKGKSSCVRETLICGGGWVSRILGGRGGWRGSKTCDVSCGRKGVAVSSSPHLKDWRGRTNHSFHRIICRAAEQAESQSKLLAYTRFSGQHVWLLIQFETNRHTALSKLGRALRSSFRT